MEKQAEDSNAILTRIMNKLTPEELDVLAKFFNRETEANSKCRKSFSPKEDERLKMLVAKYGTDNWAAIEKEMPGRNVRQCRERYKHYLSPEVSQQPWTQEEDELLLAKVSEIGSKWVAISKFFHNRTDINVKNRWVVLMRRNASLGPENAQHNREAQGQPQAQGETPKPGAQLTTGNTFNPATINFSFLPPLKLNLSKSDNTTDSTVLPSTVAIIGN